MSEVTTRESEAAKSGDALAVPHPRRGGKSPVLTMSCQADFRARMAKIRLRGGER